MNGDNTVCQSLDTTLLAYGVTDVSVRQRVAETIKTQSQALFEALIKYEDTLTLSERGALFGQTDLVGKLSPSESSSNAHKIELRHEISIN